MVEHAGAVVGGASPFGFALGAVTGSPSSSTRPRATGWDERRTPSVPFRRHDGRHRGARRHDQGQRAGPVARHEIARRRANVRDGLRHRDRVDEDEQRLGVGPSLQLEDAPDRPGVERGDGEPVEGLGRKRHHATSAERVGGGA
jgi:hypothetical protein